MLHGFATPSRDGRGRVTPGGPDRLGDVQADAELVRRTAAWLRVDADGAWAVGLTGERDVCAMTALLDMLAAELPSMDPAVRRTTVAWCRAALGEAPHPRP